MPTEITPSGLSLGMEMEREGRPLNNGLYVPTTDQKFHFGKPVITWDGRLFRYAYASGECYTGRGNVFFNAIPATGIDYANNIAVAAPVGSRTLQVTNGATVAQTKDCLVGGLIVLKPASDSSDAVLSYRIIVGNTAAATEAICTITLDAPLDTALTTSSYCYCMPSPYSSIKYLSTSGGISFAGPSAAHITASGYFGFIQTYGMWNGSAQTERVGKADYYRSVYWRHDGSLDIHSQIGTNVTDQRAGYIMDNNAAANGATVIMLQNDFMPH